MNRLALGFAVVLHGGLLALLLGAGLRGSEAPLRQGSTAVRLIAAPVVLERRPPARLLAATPHLPMPQAMAVSIPSFLISAPSSAAPTESFVSTVAAVSKPTEITAAQRPAPAEAAKPQEARFQAASLPPEHGACSARGVERLYPLLLRERGVEGRVLLRVQVDEQGRAAEVLVQGGSGWRLLDEAARQVALSCPFQPARRGDQRVSSWVEYPVQFALGRAVQ